MDGLTQITRVIVALGILFCHHVRSVQEPTDTKVQDQNTLQKRLLNQILENSNTQASLIPLLNGKALALENEFKALSKKIGNKGDNHIQKLALKLDDIETIVALLNGKFDTIEQNLDIITANLKYPRREWKNFDGVYYFFSNDAATWDEAKAKCEAMNSSSLVTIGSKQINDFLIRNGNNDAYWTGGNDIKQEKRWVWEGKGNVLTYTDWRSREPNNSGGKEDCLVMYTQPDSRKNHWNDLKCGAYNRYICQTSTTPTQ